MPLQFQLTQAPFRFGLAEGVEPRHAPPGTLMTAENVVWKKSGRIEKRDGTTLLANATTASSSITSGSRLATRGDELVLFTSDDSGSYTYLPASAQWRQIPGAPRPGLTWQTVLDSGTGVAASDMIISGGRALITWIPGDPSSVTSGIAWAQVIDTETGATLYGPSRVDTVNANAVHIVEVSGKHVVVLVEGANILGRAFDISTLQFDPSVPIQTLRSDCGNSGIGTTTNQAGNFVLAYANTLFAVKTYCYSYAWGAGFTQTATGTITDADPAFGVEADVDVASSGTLYVVYRTTTNFVRLGIANGVTLVQSGATITVANVPVGSTAVLAKPTGCVVVYDSAFSTITNMTSVSVSSVGVINTASIRSTVNVRMMSQPFQVGSKVFVIAADNPYTGISTYIGQNSYLLELPDSLGSGASFIPHQYAGRIDSAVAGKGSLSSAKAISATETGLLVPFQSEFSQTTEPPMMCGLRLVRVTTGESRPIDQDRAWQFGNETYVSGAVLAAYDGRILFDYGFAREPSINSLVDIAAGSIGAGNYLYGFVAEFHSAAAVVHRSPVAYSALKAIAASRTLRLTLNTVAVESKATAENGGLTSATPQTLWDAVYRSTAGGAVLQKLTVPPTLTMCLNDPTLQTVFVDDSNADSDVGNSVALASRPPIYTAGGAYDDEQPPAFKTTALHRTRLWGVDGSGRQVWFSKSFLDDPTVAPGFSANFRLQFRDEVTAIGSMDDKLVFFGASWIQYLLGDGPSSDGTNNDFAAPATIQTDAGCTNPRSVVSTPDGLMFQSSSGIYLLSRALEVSWIGRPVQDQLAAYPVVTSAVLVSKLSQVRFTCNNEAGTAGITLVYDYDERQWSTFKHWAGVTYGTPIADAVVWAGAWTFITPGGRVYVETDGTSLDGGTYVPMTLETAWLSAAGPLAFQSVRQFSLEGTSNDAHDLTISVGFDGDLSYPQTVTFAAGTPVTAVGPMESCDVTIGTRRKCQSIRFKVADATPSVGSATSGKGPSLDMMGIEVGVKQGFRSKPATKMG